MQLRLSIDRTGASCHAADRARFEGELVDVAMSKDMGSGYAITAGALAALLIDVVAVG